MLLRSQSYIIFILQKHTIVLQLGSGIRPFQIRTFWRSGFKWSLCSRILNGPNHSKNSLDCCIDEFFEWGKFYPKKVFQKVEVKLSTEISHVNFFIQKFYPKTFLSKINVTYSTLLYKQKAITQTSPNYST